MAANTPKQEVIINYRPGIECRVAILEDKKLEEFYAERDAENLHVGNIYIGRVVNIESSIQAAFIDFGIGRNGFLHISDLHPQYFPRGSKSTTEAVGRKTPHRQRPPIQECLKRGQTILVQVLKEGIGTKGPTLTSYISIPGRYLVMMPNMERHGVSRRLDDPDQRRDVKAVLDSLDLPDGFGFILRTAGLEQTKTELKRDLAYLQRLWKAIDKKQKTSRAPCELYAESNLLFRIIRDVLSSNIDRIVIDNREALNEMQEALRVVAPRSRSTELCLYDSPMPIFHAFGIEPQLRAAHERRVPLPSGGSLIIDSAEAMVVIDVNSGRMGKYNDAETTAYRANLEAVDEICRQLRLRDLGGLIVLDLIDMRSASHRRDVENRLKDNLKRDRAKTQILRISSFGLMEMTRQRVRPSLGRAYTMECPSCTSRGYVRTPEAAALDALRDLGYFLQLPQIDRMEMVVSDKVAGVLLSTARREIGILEDQSQKHVDIRVSRTVSLDQIDMFGYDARNVDVDLTRLAAPKLEESCIKPAERALQELDAEDADFDEFEAEEDTGERRPGTAGREEKPTDAADEGEGEGEGKGRRKRRRRRKRGGRRDGEETPATVGTEATGDTGTAAAAHRGREARPERRPGEDAEPARTPAAPRPGAAFDEGEDSGSRKSKRSRSRRRKKRGSRSQAELDGFTPEEAQAESLTFADDEQGTIAPFDDETAAAARAAAAITAVTESDVEADLESPEPPRRRRRRSRSIRSEESEAPESSIDRTISDVETGEYEEDEGAFDAYDSEDDDETDPDDHDDIGAYGPVVVVVDDEVGEVDESNEDAFEFLHEAMHARAEVEKAREDEDDQEDARPRRRSRRRRRRKSGARGDDEAAASAASSSQRSRSSTSDAEVSADDDADGEDTEREAERGRAPAAASAFGDRVEASGRSGSGPRQNRAASSADTEAGEEGDESDADSGTDAGDRRGGRSRGGRSRGRGRGRGGRPTSGRANGPAEEDDVADGGGVAVAEADAPEGDAPRSNASRKRRSRGRSSRSGETAAGDGSVPSTRRGEQQQQTSRSQSQTEKPTMKQPQHVQSSKQDRTRPPGGSAASVSAGTPPTAPAAGGGESTADASGGRKPRRTLYHNRRKVNPAQLRKKAPGGSGDE